MAVANDVNAAPPESDLTPDDLVRRARELRPRMVELQADTEERTYYSPELHEAFQEAGLYRIYIPRRYGGHEFDVLTFVRVLIELARGCASTAWCFGLATAHALSGRLLLRGTDPGVGLRRRAGVPRGLRRRTGRRGHSRQGGLAAGRDRRVLLRDPLFDALPRPGRARGRAAGAHAEDLAAAAHAATDRP